jgi:8-oxo-dGTP diphosphatase
MINFSINKPDKSKNYIRRHGAYGIIKNADGLVAIVRTKNGYFLPGGGQEKGESLTECLKRECLEEIGAVVCKLNCFASGDYYFLSTTLNIDIESIGHFFTCEIDKFLDVETEDDNELVWLDLDEAISSMYLDNQKEALKIFKNNVCV